MPDHPREDLPPPDPIRLFVPSKMIRPAQQRPVQDLQLPAEVPFFMKMPEWSTYGLNVQSASCAMISLCVASAGSSRFFSSPCFRLRPTRPKILGRSPKASSWSASIRSREDAGTSWQPTMSSTSPSTSTPVFESMVFESPQRFGYRPTLRPSVLAHRHRSSRSRHCHEWDGS